MKHSLSEPLAIVAKQQLLSKNLIAYAIVGIQENGDRVLFHGHVPHPLTEARLGQTLKAIARAIPEVA